MLDSLKKAFGNKEGAVAGATDQVAQLQSELQTAMDMIGQVEEQLLEKTSLLEAALGKLAEFEAVANAAKAEAEAAAAQAAEMKMAQRKAALGNVIGSENPQFDVIFGAIANMEDAAFDAFVGASALRFEQEAKSDKFKEVGFTADAVDVKLEAAVISETERILREQFN